MAKFFVYDNKAYPSPGAPEPFEIRQKGFVDTTRGFAKTREEAETLCAKLTREHEAYLDAQARARLQRNEGRED